MAQNTPIMKMTRRYGRTVYEVAAYCSPDSKATYEDRLLQLIDLVQVFYTSEVTLFHV